MKQEAERINESMLLVFLQNCEWIMDIRSLKTIQILFGLIVLADPDGYINLSSDVKKRLYPILGVSRSTFGSAIRELLDMNVIIRNRYTNKEMGLSFESTCEFVLNPWMFWRGDYATRRAILYGAEEEGIAD